VREPARITLEELDGDAAVVRISATPRLAAEGRHLASELLRVVAGETSEQSPVDGDGDQEPAAPREPTTR
jgi:hypothetical protein